MARRSTSMEPDSEASQPMELSPEVAVAQPNPSEQNATPTAVSRPATSVIEDSTGPQPRQPRLKIKPYAKKCLSCSNLRLYWGPKEGGEGEEKRKKEKGKKGEKKGNLH